MSLFSELKRRNVFKVAAAYIVVGWLILQVGEVLSPALRLPDWVLSTLAFFIILGFPLALLFAWAFELTPDGLKKEKDVDRSESVTHVTGQKLNRVTAGLLVVAVAYILWDVFVRPDGEGRPEMGAGAFSSSTENAAAPISAGAQDQTGELTPANDKSIAVLPFQNRSANEENAAFFADGVHDELLTNLSKIGDLKVISRTSVMRFRESDMPMREIGEELGVATLLEGGVQRAGDQLRVNVQLIKAATDEHLWAETYDRELTTENIFAIQSDIALAIADALEAALSPEVRADLQRPPTASLEAYELYLQAAQLSDHSNWESLEQALEYADHAIAQDPDFAQAIAKKASILIDLHETGARTVEAVRHPVKAAIERALELDPGSGVAHAVRAAYLEMLDAPGAAEAFEKALRLEPNTVHVLVEYAGNRLAASDPERALELLQRARELDPLSLSVLLNVARTWNALGEVDRALDAYARIREIDPSSILGKGPTSGPYLMQGLINRSLFWVHEGWKTDPADLDLPNWVVRNYMDLGDFQAASGWLGDILDANPDFPMTLANRAVLAAEMGEMKTAVRLAVRHLAGRHDNRWGSESMATDVLLIDAVRRAEPSTALDLLRARRPGLFDASPAVNADNVLHAVNVAHLLRLAGEDENARSLLQTVMDFTDQPYALTGDINAWRVSARARALALLGEKQAALAELQKQIDGGWRDMWRWQIGHSPNFDGLRDEPAFRAMIEFLENDMRRQLQEVRGMEARGEIPPPPGMYSRGN
jgi:TolB-like protein/Tfp pilus assembly protein PilF